MLGAYPHQNRYSNTVQRYMGKNQLETQYLTDVLKTQNGIEFDLRYLALE
jgi:hypothetical protein